VLYSPLCTRETRGGLLFPVEIGLLAAQPALGLGGLHALDRAKPNQVGLELRDHREDVEQQPPDRVGRVIDRAAERKADLARGELVGDRPGIGQSPRQTVELVTTEVSPARQAARASRSPGRSRLVPVRP
jgi:hypothetical protein